MRGLLESETILPADHRWLPTRFLMKAKKQENIATTLFPICGDPISPICQKMMLFLRPRPASRWSLDLAAS